MRIFGFEIRRAPVDERPIEITRIALGVPDGDKWIKLLDLDTAWFYPAIERKGVWELHFDGVFKGDDGKPRFRLKPHVANVWIYGERRAR